MNYNPYAPPQPGGPQPGGGFPQQGGGAAQPWEPGEVLSAAWNKFGPNWVTLVFTLFVSGLIGAVPRMIPIMLLATKALSPHDDEYQIVNAICAFIGFVVQMLFQAGLIKIWLTAARGGSPSFGDMFSNMGRFPAILGTMFLLIVGMYVGMIFLVVPGVIFGLGCGLAQYFVVDKEMGPIAALKASWDATNGHKGKLFLMGLLSVGILILGCVACYVGMFVALPLISLAYAIVYLRLTGQDPAYGGMGGGFGGGFGGAPGGFGPPPAGGFGAPPGGGFAPPGAGGYGGPPGGYGGPSGGGYGGPPGGGRPPGY